MARLKDMRHTSLFLLLLVGGKMIYDSRFKVSEDDIPKITHKVMFVLAIATSLYALAAGFPLTILNVNPYAASAIVGMTIFVF